MGKVQCAIACLGLFPKSSLNASREEAAEGVQEQQRLARQWQQTVEVQAEYPNAASRYATPPRRYAPSHSLVRAGAGE